MDSPVLFFTINKIHFAFRPQIDLKSNSIITILIPTHSYHNIMSKEAADGNFIKKFFVKNDRKQTMRELIEKGTIFQHQMVINV